MATWRNTATRWGRTARLFHWVIAALIVSLFIVGLVMEDISGTENRRFVYAMHKSMGLLVLALIICRIVWRLADKAPLPVGGLPQLMHLAATAAHWGLYALMLAVPVSGWLMHALSGYQTHWFGQENLPLLPAFTLIGPPDRARVEFLSEVHELSAFGLIGLAIVHALAAFYHHFIRKDATLSRMTCAKDPSA